MANRLRAASAGSPAGLRLRVSHAARRAASGPKASSASSGADLDRIEPQRQARRIVAGELPGAARRRRIAGARASGPTSRSSAARSRPPGRSRLGLRPAQVEHRALHAHRAGAAVQDQVDRVAEIGRDVPRPWSG